MFNNTNAMTVLIVLFIAALCVFIQKFFKKYLESDQYYYLKDITLVAAWALFGIWAPDGPLRVTIAAGVVAACIGFCQKVTKGRNLRFLYFLVGLGFSLFGPRIAFIEFSHSEYYYLSYFASLTISTLWMGIFPIFFQEIDEVPGMCGLLLAISWTLVSAVILSSSQNLREASQICITGMIFLLVLWSRHIHAYRRLTEPLTALWGTLFAGVSILGISKGIPFYTLALLSIGLFALPLAETLLSVISAALSPKPTGNLIIYRKLIARGMDHASAIHTVVMICAITGCLAACFQIGADGFFSLITAAAVIFAVTGIFFRVKFASVGNKGFSRRPGLWGIRVDNISLNYAISQVQHWITSENTPHIIVTPDALAALRSRSDRRYRKIVREAGLVLPDGTGLIMALRIIGSPIQERIPGVEFTEHLCKRAAYEGWSVWLLGGGPGVSKIAGDVLAAKYPGLVIAGTNDGFFKADETGDICAEIAASGAKILFVGLGVPKQEYWLEDNLAATGAIVGMGIGGSMDVLSGRLSRAPKIWQKLGLEWLYRTIQEPWRWRRIMKLPIFVFYIFLTVMHIDWYKEDGPDVSYTNERP
ncbi:MAG: WecB/TagA/CpsF family glycosyltransferase [Synergistaceae bacterium]|nr:WecB/TagA/CpsF family glycosyltransferase [Synergistaceae bacterium]